MLIAVCFSCGKAPFYEKSVSFENKEWTTLIGDILVDIIDRQYEGEKQIESNN